MHIHDLVFVTACLAGAAHLLWLSERGGLLHGGVQEPLVDPQAYEEDAARLAEALAEAPAREAPADAPDLVLITLAGVRADLFPPEGGAVEAWSQQARAFTGLRSTAPYTEAALGSLAVGALPSEHGAVRSRKGALRPMHVARPTLAERLAEAGWRTISISGQGGLGALQLDRGFDVALDAELERLGSNLPYTAADRITELGLAALEARGARPVMLQLNYADAELPWLLRLGHCEEVVPMPEALPIGGFLRRKSSFGARSRAILAGQRGARPQEVQTWTAAYRSELCWLDAQLGRLLNEGAGLGPEDLVVIVGLHGASLGEADVVGSGRAVIEPLLAAPLWVRGPGLSPGADAVAWSLDALPDRILGWLGLAPMPPQALPAPEGVRVAELHGPAGEDTVPALKGRFTRSQRAFREADHVFIVGGDNRHLAFDLARSPDQRTPAVSGDWLAPLRELALAWTEQATAPEGVK